MPDFSHCTSGCRTGGHSSWGECMRAKETGYFSLGGTRPSNTAQRRFARDTDRMTELVRAGGSISTYVNKGPDAAYREVTK